MLKMISGCRPPVPEALAEGYEVVKDSHMLVANVDADKIFDVMADFIANKAEPLFFFLEVPVSRDRESADEQGRVKAMHKDVYYLDGLDCPQALMVLVEHRGILIADGLSSFGFGGHDSQDEIQKDAYNIVTLRSKALAGYDGFFERHDIARTDKLVTAWDTIDGQHPGERVKTIVDGHDIHDLVRQLKKRGLYRQETREED